MGHRDEGGTMAGTNSGTSTQGQDAVRCDKCGAEREAAEEANQEVTHCEWCGAEYPVPDES
jgi:hypothetical protein